MPLGGLASGQARRAGESLAGLQADSGALRRGDRVGGARVNAAVFAGPAALRANHRRDRGAANEAAGLGAARASASPGGSGGVGAIAREATGSRGSKIERGVNGYWRRAGGSRSSSRGWSAWPSARRPGGGAKRGSPKRAPRAAGYEGRPFCKALKQKQTRSSISPPQILKARHGHSIKARDQAAGKRASDRRAAEKPGVKKGPQRALSRSWFKG
jgi:hypothetical protein